MRIGMLLIIWLLNISFVNAVDMNAAISWQDLPNRIAGESPVYPLEQKRDGLEGWVVVSLVVNKQGNVIQPIITLSSGTKAFEQSTLSAVTSWKFSSTPKDMVWNHVLIEFRQDADGYDGIFDEDIEEGEVNYRFLSRFKKAMGAITDGDIVQAQEKWLELSQREKRNWTENSYLWVLEAYLYDKQGLYPLVLKATDRVLINGLDTIPPKLVTEVLKKRFVAAIQSSQYNTAMNTFSLIAQLADDSVKKAFSSYYQQAKSLIEGPDVLESVGVIKPIWYQGLTHPNIVVTALEGAVSQLYVRCSDFHQSLHASKRTEIVVPDAAKDCQLILTGQENTVVLVQETPKR